MTTPARAPEPVDRKLLRLIEAVNRQRYRSPAGRLTGDYYWPQAYEELEEIAKAALRYVVSLEEVTP